ncbi:arsenic resistance protein [Gordonia rhizosphera NBRC 16068]|uniref:arsenic resistance protein n=1 Tax=Gordonia rhizosphera TaxID=83341 RepID=UPI003EE147D2
MQSGPGDRVSSVAAVLERHQVVLYVAAIGAGAVIGLGIPGGATVLEHAINPALAALLYVTFLQVPARTLVAAVRDVRFMAAVLTVNFVVVPVVVAAMFGFLPSDQAVRIGVLLVLLCPCVDYVIVFSGLAGGDNHRLLAATPALLLLQMAVLPLFLVLILGSELADIVEVGPFVEAFVVLIVIPLTLAWLTQWWSARHPAGQRFSLRASTTMVPLMMLVLTLVVASQFPKVDDSLSEVAAVVPFYVLFLAIMPVAGIGVGRMFGLATPARRAVVFSGATRNSLVVLPLALALPAGLELAAAVVVTQTLVEVIGMVVYVRLVPRLLPQPSAQGPDTRR